MKYMQIDGVYMDCPDPEEHLKELFRNKGITYERYVMMVQLISYGFRKVIDAEHKTIFQLSDTPIRPQPRVRKKHEPEPSLS
jgi:hypothetical protein